MRGRASEFIDASSRTLQALVRVDGVTPQSAYRRQRSSCPYPYQRPCEFRPHAPRPSEQIAAPAGPELPCYGALPGGWSERDTKLRPSVKALLLLAFGDDGRSSRQQRISDNSIGSDSAQQKPATTIIAYSNIDTARALISVNASSKNPE
ncbi:hypothetical protein V492_06089 [Pseudogymnoascus sp. VKM F-4246]|nr:hypothetical protein V492_06089 [Pseudogymnoascus sp. VKM F-4246]